jgi:hypothetical protein
LKEGEKMKYHIINAQLLEIPFEEGPLTGLLWWGPFVGAILTLIPIILIAGILIRRWRRRE